ncbi:MAG: hypothetical protein ACREE4_02685 [Stellaceae bacterium]
MCPCRDTARALILALAGLLAGCHGSTLDALYPGSFGHTLPPAVNLPAQDCPKPAPGAWPHCLPTPSQPVK